MTKPTGSTVPSSAQAHARDRRHYDFEYVLLDSRYSFGLFTESFETNSSPRIMFGWLLILAILELGFTVDTFQYLQRKNAWTSTQERQTISFLLFSSLRSVILAAVYLGSHFANKWFKSLHHTVRLFCRSFIYRTYALLNADLPLPQHRLLVYRRRLSASRFGIS
jgi:hypothetical protein